MSKIELTDEQKSFRLDPLTLNNQFSYWILKSNCLWNLRETNNRYDELRLSFDHAMAFEKLKVKMFQVGECKN